MTSLRTQLWFWLLGLMTLAGLLAATFAYWSAQDEAKGFFDNQLRLMAIYVGDPVGAAPAMVVADDADPVDVEDNFLVQVWDGGGRLIRSSLPSEKLAAAAKTGFSDTASTSGSWRTYTLVAANRTVQVSQQSIVRAELASDAAWRSLVPVAVVIPLSWLLLSLVINRILRRIDAVALQTQSLIGRKARKRRGGASGQRRIKNAVMRTHHGLFQSERLPRETYARAEIELVGKLNEVASKFRHRHRTS